MELITSYIMDFFKSWPVLVVNIAALLVLLGWWAKSNIPTKAELKAVAQARTDLETLNAAQHKAMTDGFQSQVERISNSIREQMEAGNKELRETLRLHNITTGESIGRAHERLDQVVQQLSVLQGEHDVAVGRGHCQKPHSQKVDRGNSRKGHRLAG